MRRQRSVARKKPMLSWEDARSETIAEIDRRIDQFYGNYKAFDPKIYDLLNEKEFNTRQATILLRHYLPSLQEIKDVCDNTDSDLQEAYHHLSPLQKVNYLKFINCICSDLARYCLDKKAPRKKREIPVSSILKHFVYKKEDLGVVSVPPEQILGAAVVVLYNTKYHKVTYLKAKDSKGLQIYRMNIFNYDQEASITKISRKVDVADFKLGTLAHVKKIIDDIKNKPGILVHSHWVGPDTLILRVFR